MRQAGLLPGRRLDLIVFPVLTFDSDNNDAISDTHIYDGPPWHAEESNHLPSMSTQNYHRAIATTRLGEIDEIKLPTEDVKGDRVLIKVEYASLTALDTYLTDLGFYVDGVYPTVLGFNSAGTVAQLGEDVKDLAVGDRVRFFCN
jgi:hypothetical protein